MHWIEGVTRDESVCKAARHSLKVRLADVQHYLPLAAERPHEDVQYVHQLRVCTRRTIAALNLYSGVLPKKEVKWLANALRKIRRAAGNARDIDVLAESHEADTGKGTHAFLDDVRQRREAAQKPIVAIHRRLQADDRLRKHVEDLLDKIGVAGSEEIAFGRWATSRLRKILKRFFKASPSNPRDLDRLHRFRIRGKELRYAMELLAPAFPTEFREELYPVVEQVQERLGQIHDHAVARDRFGKWVTEAKSKKEVVHVRELREKEHVKLCDLLREFASWWTPEFQARLRDSFDCLTGRIGSAVSV
jgi:CHAD domain-containing protein